MKKGKLLGIIVGLILLVFLLYQINITDLTNTLMKISMGALIFGFILYFLGYLFRAIRFKVILNKPVSFLQLFKVVALHNFFTQVLPARSGEISFIYLLRRRGFKGSEATASIFLARFFDLLAVAIIFLFGLFFIQLEGSIKNIYMGLILFFLIFVALFFIYFKWNEQLFRFFIKFLHLIRVRGEKVLKFIEEANDEVYNFLKKPRKFILSLFLSLILWIILFILPYYFLILFGINIGFFTALVALSLTLLLALVPIQSFLNLGTYEGIWALVFMLVGVDKELAITSGISFHFVFIFYFVIFALLALIIRE
jgi:glycosyltransferase 2 family protein